MIFPAEIEKRAQRLFEKQWRQWAVAETFASEVVNEAELMQEGKPLLHVGLKPPKEADFAQGTSLAEAQQWARAWNNPPHPCKVEWAMRRWVRVEDQRIPVSMEVVSARDVAIWADRERLWKTALERLGQLRAMVEEEGYAASDEVLLALRRSLGTWANLSNGDWHRGLSVLRWLLRNPDPRCFGRQLPVRGIDTKWLEQAGGAFVDLARLLTEEPVTLLRQTAPVFRCVAGSSELAFGTIRDYSLTPDALSQLPHHPKALLICENLVNVLCVREVLSKAERLRECLAQGLAQDGAEDPARDSAEGPSESSPERLAKNMAKNPAGSFQQQSDIPVTQELELACALDNVLVVWGRGFAAEGLRDVDWISQTPIVYWGDIDTHGFAILSMVRSFVPLAQSVMMDEATLQRYRDLCIEEPSPTDTHLANLTDAEAKTMARLFQEGRHLRLEQERVEWLWACEQLTKALERIK